MSKSSSFACQYQYPQALYFFAISSCFSFVAKNLIKANTLHFSGSFGSSNHSEPVTIFIILFLRAFSLSKTGI
jgi:hypothetical protein